MAKVNGECIEGPGGLPLVDVYGLNTNKDVDFSGASIVSLPANSYAGGLLILTSGDIPTLGVVLTNQSTPQTIGNTGNRLAKLWVTDITITNAMVGDITGNAGTVSNGVYLSATQTISSKRITERSVTTTQSATPTINTDNTDVVYITGLAQAITSMTTNLSGTPNANDKLIISITDNGTARAITWGNSFEPSGNTSLPTTTVISTRLDVGFLWNIATSKWRCIGWT